MLYHFPQKRREPDKTCMLDGARICDAPDCAGCGWRKAEIERRHRLPLWRDAKTGLWRMRVGVKSTGS